MKCVWLSKDGEVIEKPLKELKTDRSKHVSWEQLNNFVVDKFTTREEYLFLKRYGLTCTYFNIGCLRNVGLILLPSKYYIKSVLRRGAIDRRVR